MYYTADLHIHSRFAKATSKYLSLETLYQWAVVKGVDVIGTGDFTHPAWFAELVTKLKPEGNGFFVLKDPPQDLPYDMKMSGREVRFCLTTEINCETFYQGRQRRVHNLVYAPDFDTVRKISKRLSDFCNLEEDGRPTLPISSRNLLEIVLESSPDAHFVPAHIWTPWFSLLGSMNGYDSVEQCFGDLTPHIFALETSLSADPDMCASMSSLDRYTLMSNSDAHSAENVGREVNLLDTDMDYFSMFRAFQTKKGFPGTYEFFPELGKYYLDGHRNCKTMLDPERSNELGNICPSCGKPVTIGTLGRTMRLGDRKKEDRSSHAASFRQIMPLPEILSEIHGVSEDSKKVKSEFGRIISGLGCEFDILHNLPVDDIRKKDHLLALAIKRMREGTYIPVPGYDGAYGRILFFEENELKKLKQPQISLF